MAPELLSPKKFNQTSAQPTKPADVYAFGMVILEALTGLQPFFNEDWQIFEMVLHVIEGRRPTKPDDAGEIGLGEGTWELVEECWTKEPKGRPTIDRVLAHLTRVATSSTAAGPNPETLHAPLEWDSSSEDSVVVTRSTTHVGLEGTMVLPSRLPQRRAVTLDDTILSERDFKSWNRGNSHLGGGKFRSESLYWQ
jgi:serine/threonine protein kinase